MVRIPLPPGATLAEKVENTWQVQGAVYVRTQLDNDTLPRVIEVPLRFALAGTITMPEATARITDDEIAPARAPARPLVVGNGRGRVGAPTLPPPKPSRDAPLPAEPAGSARGRPPQ